MSNFPNVDIHVITMPLFLEESQQDQKNKVLKFIESEQPDILILTEKQFKDVSSENVLMDLDILLNEDKDKQFLSGIVPTVTDYLRSIGLGKLYGLSNNFNSLALYYNKDLFDRSGIPYPQNGMNWEEVLKLSQWFNEVETESYGLMVSNDPTPFKLALQVGLSKNLRYVDSTEKKVLINSEQWRNVFEMVLQSFQSKSIYELSDSEQPIPGMTYKDVLHLNPFLSGKTAMTISGNYLTDQIKDFELFNQENKLNWDLVTIPSDNQTINISSYIWLDNVVSIYSKASNVNTAWEFMKYINGDEYARISSIARLNSSLTSRTEYLKDAEGHNFEAFYELSIAPNDLSWMERLPQAFYSAFNEAGEKELNKVYEGQTSIDQALQNLEVKGSHLLTEIKN